MKYSNEMARGNFPCKCAIMRDETFINHCHSELEMISVRSGTLDITIENTPYTLNKGDIFVIPPFVNHSIDKASGDHERIAMLMEPGILGVWDGKNRIFPDVDELLEQIDGDSRHWESSVRDRIEAMIAQIYAEYTKRPKLWQLSIKSIVDQFLVLSVRSLPRRTQPANLNKQMTKLKTILSYIAMNYCDDISLEACADRVGFNATYLSRYFKKYMHTTYQDYVKSLRIDKAKWLLRTEDMTITDISGECGFHDIRTFNKLFKKETGMNPTAFRDSCKRQ